MRGYQARPSRSVKVATDRPPIEMTKTKPFSCQVGKFPSEATPLFSIFLDRRKIAVGYCRVFSPFHTASGGLDKSRTGSDTSTKISEGRHPVSFATEVSVAIQYR